VESVAAIRSQVSSSSREAGKARGRRAAPLHAAVAISIAVHGALVAGALALPARASVDEVPVVVDIVAPPVIDEPPPASPPPAPEPPRMVKLARQTQVRAVPAAVAPIPPPRAPVADETPPEAPAAAVPEARNDTGDVPVPAGPAGRGAGTAPGVPGGTGTGAVAGPPVAAGPTEAQRKSLVDGYLADIFRTRIKQNFRYPDGAGELELTGRVIVRVTVDRHGRLLAARLAGRCPHALLCEDGLRTLRASAPFPPPPSDLGDAVVVDVPLNYDLP
jgi:periplasmic protein TonB